MFTKSSEYTHFGIDNRGVVHELAATIIDTDTDPVDAAGQQILPSPAQLCMWSFYLALYNIQGHPEGNSLYV